MSFEPGGVAFGAGGLFFPVNEGFEVVIASLADVFEDWHGGFNSKLFFAAGAGKASRG